MYSIDFFCLCWLVDVEDYKWVKMWNCEDWNYNIDKKIFECIYLYNIFLGMSYIIYFNIVC